MASSIAVGTAIVGYGNVLSARLALLVRYLNECWNALGMTMRFAVVTSSVLLCGMVLLGEWAAKRVEEGVIHSHAASAALYAANHVNRRVQELASHGTLSDGAKRDLDHLLESPLIGWPVVGFRIWKDDTIVYAERSELIGQVHQHSTSRTRAMAGEVVAVYRAAARVAAELRIASSERLLEIYAPVRETGSDRVIALVETYELAPSLKADIESARKGVWLLVSLLGVHILLLQTVFLHHSSRIITRQRVALDERVAQLSRMLAENSTLRNANEAGARVTQESERHLRKLGADLHDGPLQLLAMAMLRLGALPELVKDSDAASLAEATEDVAVVCDCLKETMSELRNIASGLALPDIETSPLPEVIARAARSHARRSGLPVRSEIAHDLPETQAALKVCAYRLVQEGLSNCYRHAGGHGQAVVAVRSANGVEISILDDGPGLGAANPSAEDGGRGIKGLRDRVASLGGTLNVRNREEGGTALSAWLPLDTSASITSMS